MTLIAMMGAYALIKDSKVINYPVAWEGGDLNFGDGIEPVEVPAGTWVEIGYAYDNGVFTAPPLTDEQIAANNAAKIRSNQSMKSSLMNAATQRISVLQDAVDLDMATDDETAALPLWKKYRVLLNRVNVSAVDDISWPEAPAR